MKKKIFAAVLTLIATVAFFAVTTNPVYAIDLFGTQEEYAEKLPEVFLAEGSSSTKLDEILVDDLTNVEDFTLHVGNNKIVYLESVDLSSTDIANLGENVILTEDREVTVKSDNVPELNKPARIIIKGLPFSRTPTILKDGENANDIVSNIEYDTKTGKLSFEVDSFSTYSVIQTRNASYIWPGIGPTTWQEVIRSVINIILIVVVVSAVFYIMIAGLKYISSRGDKDKSKEAMSAITNAIIGIIVAFSAYAVIQLVLNNLGADSILVTF